MKSLLHFAAASALVVGLAACDANRSLEEQAEDARDRIAETVESVIPDGATEPRTPASEPESRTAEPQTTTDPTEPGEMTMTGEIVDVDTEAGTITLQQTFRVTESTDIDTESQVQALAGSRGSRATIHFRQDASGEPTAVRIEVE